ncbi:glycogen debranching enzyme N-terminal domain-containing protein [Microbacter margulisiae]|uniref:Putative glycogen debranching enzyme n=1 Tax=Microbacter margulisiae TaxID=1350067 RepID=A0A7W5DPP8_9PORP|nr:glycogen debranching enzyme N-terminal domain-containing protein [Microbacter margulisiae]MBB3186697.1 putative glycogen debranching enzyme [Microbacter margulisiae]
MSYLKFDKSSLTNLEKSLRKEILRTNKSGAYSATTLVDCNTRKYHGLLVVPVPELSDSNHVLLSSLDETVIQHGAEFNLGVHEYENNFYSPNGQKYIREFHLETVSKTIYRVGGVILSKERIFISHENRFVIRYTLLDAHSPTTLRFRPFLAFRSVHELCIENDVLNDSINDVANGISMCLYQGYPALYMQFSKSNQFVSDPHWYNGIKYFKEQERGYDYKEDLYVPGYFECAIKKGEALVFSAGTSSVEPRTLFKLYDDEVAKRTIRSDFFHTLKNAAQQFYLKSGDNYYLLAGYPWFKVRARDEFIALAGATLVIDDRDMFEKIMQTASVTILSFLEGNLIEKNLYELEAPDVLLWAIRAIQYYADFYGIKDTTAKYGDLILSIINFIRKQKHPNLFLHENGLLYTNGNQKAATWMNATENGIPIIQRSGYIVEINALWYNALKFSVQIATEQKDEYNADLLDYQSEVTKQSFVDVFWNGTYLYDFVDGQNANVEVRPNMVMAVALPYSPLDKEQQKSVLDLITRELLTPKGLRTLSPKSSLYRPFYVGSQLQRDRNYHNGPVWPWLAGAFADAYLKIYKRSGFSFIERLLIGFESEMKELCVGTLSELHDGNPPFLGHGAMSFAMSVAEILRIYRIVYIDQIQL